MMERKLIIEARKWLVPLGYSEIYSINHPTENKDEVHFIKDGIRVCCYQDHEQKYCKLSRCILNEKIPTTASTAQFSIGTEMLEVAIANFKQVLSPKPALPVVLPINREDGVLFDMTLVIDKDNRVVVVDNSERDYHDFIDGNTIAVTPVRIEM